MAGRSWLYWGTGLMRIKFRYHAIRRMFERDISEEFVRNAISRGEVIEDYPSDKPYPSVLMMYSENGKSIHVVVASDDETPQKLVITVYHPDSSCWENEFRRRKP